MADAGESLFAAAEAVGSGIMLLTRPAHTWPAALRRPYVLTWPVSWMARGLAVVALLVISGLLGLAGMVVSRLAHVWAGTPSD